MVFAGFFISNAKRVIKATGGASGIDLLFYVNQDTAGLNIRISEVDTFEIISTVETVLNINSVSLFGTYTVGADGGTLDDDATDVNITWTKASNPVGTHLFTINVDTANLTDIDRLRIYHNRPNSTPGYKITDSDGNIIVTTSSAGSATSPSPYALVINLP